MPPFLFSPNPSKGKEPEVPSTLMETSMPDEDRQLQSEGGGVEWITSFLDVDSLNSQTDVSIFLLPDFHISIIFQHITFL